MIRLSTVLVQTREENMLPVANMARLQYNYNTVMNKILDADVMMLDKAKFSSINIIHI